METTFSTHTRSPDKLTDWFSERALCHEPRMLVVEDDRDLEPVMRRVIRSIRPDVTVDWVSDARSARSLLGIHFYDVVLVDQCLGEDGSGLSLRARCWEIQPQAIFAVMSAWPLSDYLHSVGGAGTPFLRKPFALVDCRAFLRALLRPLGDREPRRTDRRAARRDAIEETPQ
jgi:DNA-binding response OmpR family regulator